jgi:hypothetical protein
VPWLEAILLAFVTPFVASFAPAANKQRHRDNGSTTASAPNKIPLLVSSDLFLGRRGQSLVHFVLIIGIKVANDWKHLYRARTISALLKESSSNVSTLEMDHGGWAD